MSNSFEPRGSDAYGSRGSRGSRGFRGSGDGRGYRGSRGYRGRGTNRFQTNFEPSLKLQEGLFDRDFDVISLPAKSVDPSVKVEATNVVTLGSYNWVDHPTPTMVIPGHAPVRKELELPFQLELDSGESFSDQNTNRLPLSPFEPMFRAIKVTQKQLGNDFKFSDENLDIISDRNNLRKLMRFITSHGPNRDPRPGSNREFRIDIQLAPNGRTLVLTRRDDKTVEPPRFKSYGRNFEKAATEHVAPILTSNSSRTVISRLQSTGHHRITRFDLLGLRFLVRYEVDAMILKPLAKAEDEDEDEDEGNLDFLTKAFARTSLSDSKLATKPIPVLALKKPESIVDVPNSELRHIVHGELVPQANILELQTLKNVYRITWSDTYTQLFLSQTPTLNVAKHSDGLISSIEIHDNNSQELKKAHNDLAPDFVSLVHLLKDIREIAKKRELAGKPFAIYWSGTGDLKIRCLHRSHIAHLPSEKELAAF